jgi:hypothetical protein
MASLVATSVGIRVVVMADEDVTFNNVSSPHGRKLRLLIGWPVWLRGGHLAY